MKTLYIIFGILAILLSDIMCAVVAYNYSALWWCGRYGLCSFPASTAFLSAIPYLIGIIVCIALAIFFRKRQKINS